MGHSVEAHLGVTIATYDEGIRRLVPGYDAMVAEVLDALERHLRGQASPHLLDLGCGTGRMTGAAIGAFPGARFTLLDTNAQMLEEARQRLQPQLDRAVFVTGSFFDPLPRCDVAMASLALHHVQKPDQKRAAYANIRAALNPGGLLVMADATVPGDPALSERAMKRWAEHMIRGGDTEAEAYARFEHWAREERYFPLEDELSFLRAAGFQRLDVTWRQGPLAVVVALV